MEAKEEKEQEEEVEIECLHQIADIKKINKRTQRI